MMRYTLLEPAYKDGMMEGVAIYENFALAIAVLKSMPEDWLLVGIDSKRHHVIEYWRQGNRIISQVIL